MSKNNLNSNIINVKPFFNKDNLNMLDSNNKDNNNINIKSKNRIEQMQKVHKEALEVFKRKKSFYSNNFTVHGIIGVFNKLSNKINEEISVSKLHIKLNNFDKIRNILMDLHNYSALALMILSDSNYVYKLEIIHNDGLELFKKKNADYGDAFATFCVVGVLVRMGDKINRLLSLMNNSIQYVENESSKDTLIDLHNYSSMAIMLLDEEE